MSKEAIKEFYDFVQTKPDLQNELNSLLDDQEAMIARAVELGRQNNYNFTADELRETISAIESGEASSELSDEELEAVAGGKVSGSADVRGGYGPGGWQVGGSVGIRW